MKASYFVIYWDSESPARAPVDSNEFPKLTSARQELRERGFRRAYGNASLNEVEEYLRPGYPESSAASISKMNGIRVFMRLEPAGPRTNASL